MANIMQALIGKEFGEGGLWILNVISPFRPESVTYKFEDFSAPFPAKNFDHREVEALRDYLSGVIDDYHRIIRQLEQINV